MENSSVTNKSSWLYVSGQAESGLAQELEAAVRQKQETGVFSRRDLDWLYERKLDLVQGEMDLTDKELEKFRRLCQLWEIDLKPFHITSHRKFVGPLIVGLKKLVFPVLRVLLKDIIQQQREFNATAISLLRDLFRARKG